MTNKVTKEPVGPALSCYNLARKGMVVCLNEGVAAKVDAKLWGHHKDDIGIIRSWHDEGGSKLVYVWFVSPVDGPCAKPSKMSKTVTVQGDWSTLVHADPESCEHAVPAKLVTSCVKMTAGLHETAIQAVLSEVSGRQVKLLDAFGVKDHLEEDEETPPGIVAATQEDYDRLFGDTGIDYA